MDYGRVITGSGRIIWKHKVLWVFGILSGCMGSVSGSGTNFSREGLSWLFNLDTEAFALPSLERWFSGVSEMFDSIPEAVLINYVLLAAAVGVLLAVIFFALGVVGRIGLVRGVWLAEKGALEFGFETIYDEVAPYFRRVAGFYLLLFLIGLLVFAVLLAIFAVTTWVGILILSPMVCVLLCLLVPLSWLVTVLTEQTVVAIAGEDLSILDALMRAWNLLKDNPGPMIIMGLLLILGPNIVSAIIGMPLLLALAPVAIGFAASGEAGLGAGLAITAVFLLVYIPFSVVLGGILRSYVGVAWALTYRSLTARSERMV